MLADLAALLELADHAADAVEGALVGPEARSDLGVDTKSSATDLVTARDRWAERTIVEALLDARPGDGIVGEEGTHRPSTSGVVWVIDPIDGTTNFVRDLPGFSVSIAARVDGIDAVAVVADPVRSDRYRATLGGGATCNGEPIQVSGISDLTRSLVATGFSYRPETRARQAEVIAALLPRIADVRRFGGAALDCCLVASGRVDGYFESGVQDWDIAAGGLIVREAGGRSLDHRDVGGPFVAATPGVLRQLADALGLEDVD